jgi:DNA-binding MarR family transcriptional regulator
MSDAIPFNRESPGGRLLTALMLETFRLNGRLLAAGDRLVAEAGLTSARWQVLGAIALAGQPLTVAQAARNMGLTRQAVQRVANDLETFALVKFIPNPNHCRAKLVALTVEGEAAYAAAMARHHPWVEGLAAGLDPAAIEAATRLMAQIGERLASARPGMPQEQAANEGETP